MRKTVTTLALVAALVAMAALPATAAPNNKNNTEVVPLDCGAPIGDAISVRTVPGEGASGWNVETGEHYVAKAFSFQQEVTVKITDGAEINVTFEDTEDFGAEAPANGRKELVECTDSFEFEDGPFTIDAEFAALLNADLQTDIFEEGQEVTISLTSTFRVLILIPGN
jgi:hypothetical protein